MHARTQMCVRCVRFNAPNWPNVCTLELNTVWIVHTVTSEGVNKWAIEWLNERKSEWMSERVKRTNGIQPFTYVCVSCLKSYDSAHFFYSICCSVALSFTNSVVYTVDLSIRQLYTKNHSVCIHAQLPLTRMWMWMWVCVFVFASRFFFVIWCLLLLLFLVHM